MKDSDWSDDVKSTDTLDEMLQYCQDNQIDLSDSEEARIALITIDDEGFVTGVIEDVEVTIYQVVDKRNDHTGDEFIEEYYKLEDANEYANLSWDRLVSSEKKVRHIYVRTSEGDIWSEMFDSKSYESKKEAEWQKEYDEQDEL